MATPLTPHPMTHRLFVYGSLKQASKANNYRARGTMYSLEVFPAALFDEGVPGTIVGQVLDDISEERLARFDQIEHEGLYYKRKRIPVTNTDTGEVEEVWAYEWMKSTANLRLVKGEPACWEGPRLPWSR